MSNYKRALVLAQIRRANSLRNLATEYQCSYTMTAYLLVNDVIARIFATE
jgi:hypothetical protein